MLNFIRRLLGLCIHKWVILHRVSVFEQDSSRKPVGFSYELQCAHCGDVKFKEG